MTTADLDAAAERLVRAAGAEPAFKGYRGYPCTLCASVNEQVVHGIPSARALVEGDIISLDMGVKLNGFYGDSAVTVPVGRVSDEAAKLLRVTRESLEKGIEQVRLGGRVSDIGHAIQEHVEAHGFSVVREFVGHGIGAALHEDPQIANYGEPGRGPRLAEGMVLAIEPMVNVGRPAVKVLGGRLDGGDQGRQPVGALRAHGRGDEDRAARADAADRAGGRLPGSGRGVRLQPDQAVDRGGWNDVREGPARGGSARDHRRRRRAGGAAVRAVPGRDRAGSARSWRTRPAGPDGTSSGC